MRAAVGEKATNEGPLPAEMRRALRGPPVREHDRLARALARADHGPVAAARQRDARRPGAAAGSCARRAARRCRPRTRTARPRWSRRRRRPPDATTTANGLRPTRSDFTVRSATRSTTASLREPLDHEGARAVGRQRDRRRAPRRGDLAHDRARGQVHDRQLPGLGARGHVGARAVAGQRHSARARGHRDLADDRARLRGRSRSAGRRDRSLETT